MADKQQNILINLKFNTAELERGTTLVNRANEATNKLQQSSQNAGKSIGDSYRSASPGLAHLTAEQKRLEDAIKSTKATSFATFKEFTKSLQGLSAQYAKVKSDIAAANKEIANQAKITKQSSASVADLTQNFGQLFTAVKTFIAAGVVKEVLQTSLEMAKLAGNVEGVSRAFNRAFPDAEMVLGDLQRATHGTVSEFELMQRTLQATNLGVAVEQLPVLFEFAAARAQQTGESVDYLVDSIVRGIGRKSILVLDNLGLSATRLKQEFDGASLASQSVGDVTQAVARIAQQELTKMGGYAETSATKVDQLTVSWKELRVELSKRFEEGGFVTQLTELVDSYQAALEAQRRGISIQDLFAERQRKEIAQIQVNGFLQRALTEDKEKYIKAIEDEITSTTRSVGAWASYRDNQEDLIRSDEKLISVLVKKSIAQEVDARFASEQIRFLEDRIALNNRLRDANKEDALIDQEALRMLQTKLQALTKDNEKETEALGIIEAKKQQIEALQEAIEKTRNLGDISSRLQIGKLVTDLAVAQAELKELTDGAANIEFKVKFSKEGVLKDFERLTEILKDIPAIPVPVELVPTIPKDFGDKFADAIKENKGELVNAGTQIFADQLISFEEAEVASLQNRLNNLRNFYDEQQILAGDNDRAKQALRLKEERETAELQKKIAQKQKEARRFSVIIDTAAGIARAFATAPNIAVAIVQAALVAAQGASQLAIINRTQARFAKGVIDLKGPGTGTSDSIHARLSKGESVMTAKETQTSLGILKDIRAKKLNDNVLQNLRLTGDGVRNVGMDDSRLLKKLDEIKNSQPNIVEQSGRLYKQFNKGKNYKVKVHIKNMGY